MKYTKILFTAGAAAFFAFALKADDSSSTYRDAQGRVVGTETRTNGTTIHRDAQGRVVATEVTSGNITYCRDAQGRTIGTKTVQGNQVFYRDAQGRLVRTETIDGFFGLSLSPHPLRSIAVSPELKISTQSVYPAFG